MYSDGEDDLVWRGGRSRSPDRRGGDVPFRRGRSPGADLLRGKSDRDERPRGGRSRSRGNANRGRSRSRSGRRDFGGSSKGAGKGGRTKTTGRELPALNTIHNGKVVSIQSFGAFVQLGDGAMYKDGLLHISRLSATGRVEKVDEMLSEGEKVIVKVCDIKEGEGKYSVDMRFVNQRTGEDLDPNNVQADSKGGGKGGGKGAEPIRIGAVLNTTCSKCGAKGHFARECFSSAGGGKYDLLEEPPEPVNDGPADRPPSKESRRAVEDALWNQMKKHRPDLAAVAMTSSSDSDSSSSSAAGKSTKKEKKLLKKQKKKMKKLAKKEKKKEKKQMKKEKKKDKKAKN